MVILGLFLPVWLNFKNYIKIPFLVFVTAQVESLCNNCNRQKTGKLVTIRKYGGKYYEEVIKKNSNYAFFSYVYIKL